MEHQKCYLGGSVKHVITKNHFSPAVLGCKSVFMHILPLYASIDWAETCSHSSTPVLVTGSALSLTAAQARNASDWQSAYHPLVSTATSIAAYQIAQRQKYSW